MRISPKKAQTIAKVVIWSAALLVIALLLFIMLYIMWKGVPTLSWQFLTENPSDMGRGGGILSTIVSTMLVTAVAIAVTTPFGVGTAFFLTEYTHEGKATRIIRFSAESLAAIPSIVYGLFGFIFFVIYLKLGWSVISGGLTMAVMILPTIIRTSEEAIRSSRENSAKSASHWVVPNGRPSSGPSSHRLFRASQPASSWASGAASPRRQPSS